MGRTNIDLDDALVAEVMSRFDVTTKQDAVHLALQTLVHEDRDFEVIAKAVPLQRLSLC